MGLSLALGYVDAAVFDAASQGTNAGLTVDIVGEPRLARILPTPPYDPTGARLRS